MYALGRVGKALRARGVRVRNLDLPKNYDLRAIRRLAGQMRRGRYDVVHVHLYRASLYGRVAARLARVPVVVTTEHSLGRDEIEAAKLTRLVRGLYLATERLSDMTIAVSPRVQRLLIELGVPAERTVVIPNGLDFERFAFDPSVRRRTRDALGIPQDALVLGTVGRLVPIKRQRALIEGAAPLLSDGAWLVVAGDGPLRSDLEVLARDRGVSERMIFCGDQQDVSTLLAAMDVFASPGAEETFGLAPLEAVANGLSVLVTHCPALDGIGTPPVTWVDAHPPALTAALREVSADPRRHGVPAELRSQYDIRATSAAVDDLYERLHAGAAQGCRRRATSVYT
jgi:glycosyltransferase involved in cell wall biosynthesis